MGGSSCSLPENNAMFVHIRRGARSPFNTGCFRGNHKSQTNNNSMLSEYLGRGELKLYCDVGLAIGLCLLIVSFRPTKPKCAVS